MRSTTNPSPTVSQVLSYRILLIEDNEDDAELLIHQLGTLISQGLTVEHCTTLAAGLRCLEKGATDLIVVDLSLPDSESSSTVASVHRVAPGLPIIVLTGLDDSVTAVDSLDNGAQDYLVKGQIDHSMFLRSMRYAMARQHAISLAERLASIVECANESIIGKTLKGTITSWNSAAERLYGYTTAEAIGKSVSMLFPNDSNGELNSILDVIKTGGTVRNKEAVRVAKDGHSIDVDLSVSAIKTAGAIVGAAAFTRDITQRKRDLLALKELEQKLSLALKAGNVGVWDLDVVTGKIWRSLRHDEIFGHDSLLPEWSFEVFLTYVLPEDREYARDVIKGGVATGEFSLECRILRADQVLRWISTCGETLKDAANKPIRMMGTVSDITDRKEQEVESRRAAVAEGREEFMATLTHDLKNPLIGANRLLELLINGALGVVPFEQAEILEQLRHSNLQLLNMIHNLIDVYRYEKDTSRLDLQETDLVGLLEECIKQAQLLTSNIINSDLPPQSDNILIDPFGIRRVVQNLLSNAVKFSPEGTITIRLKIQKNQAVIEVEDHGPGIKPEEQCHLFKRFSQGAAGKRYAGGTGLGLYLCKQIIDAHGGSIECESKLTGTIFKICLPQTNHELGHNRQ
ncbi:PAS domain S-box protein [soil metagenome]